MATTLATMSDSTVSPSGTRYFRWRWESCHGAMRDNDILKCILDNKAYCDARFKRIVMLNRSLTNNSGDEIASLIWEYCGHNPGQLCNMWRWAEHLELSNNILMQTSHTLGRYGEKLVIAGTRAKLLAQVCRFSTMNSRVSSRTLIWCLLVVHCIERIEQIWNRP